MQHTCSKILFNSDFLSLFLQSVLEKKFDQLAAIYHLMADRCRKPRGAEKLPPGGLLASNLPKATRTERRSSITTGVGKLDPQSKNLGVSVHTEIEANVKKLNLVG